MVERPRTASPLSRAATARPPPEQDAYGAVELVASRLARGGRAERRHRLAQSSASSAWRGPFGAQTCSLVLLAGGELKEDILQGERSRLNLEQSESCVDHRTRELLAQVR